MSTADPFKLETLIAWAERQPADRGYEFWCDRCYLGQYFEAHGLQIRTIGVSTVTFRGQKIRPLPPHFGSIAMTKPHTFGAALKRAREAAALQS